MPKAPKEVVLLCPRCGYDQSGACPGWLDACPLEGTCPECGLKFEWADAFNPQRKRLSWLFEHKPALSLGVIRSLRSWWMALLPPRFWRRVTPAHGTSASVVLWPLVLVASMIAVGGVLRVGFLYAIGWAGQWTAWGGGPPTGWKRAAVVAVEAWTRPLWVRYADYWSTEYFWRALTRVYAPPAAVLGSALVCGLTLMCLTTSRRICGVRPSHILRAAVYRAAPLGVLYALWFVEALFVSYPPRSWAQPSDAVRTTVLVLAFAWGAWWWWTAIFTGWVMPKARLAAALICLCDLLAGITSYVVVGNLLR